MPNLKDIRRRIKSVKNIRQITKAMELVSAAKMRKAQTAVTASRPYSVLSADLLRNLASKMGDIENRMVDQLISGIVGGSEKNLVILMTSNRGLAGAFNANVIAKAVKLIRQYDDNNNRFDFITIGKKGTDWAKRLGLNIVANFQGFDKAIAMIDVKPIVRIAMNDFLTNKYEKVFIVYPDFISTLVQKPNILQLLPFSTESGAKKIMDQTLFEPSPGEVLENLIIRAVEFMVFQSLLEEAASEHSARMVAMRNANEAAGDLIDDLTLSGNQARQSGITRELSEISAAKLAMEG
jgi:F-type H+-transporting ATPase subunit gamma